MPDQLDPDLLRRFVHGDRDAFESLFRQFDVEVYRWSLAIVRDASMAEDVVVEAFWRAYRGRARFDWSRSFGAWMRRIIANRIQVRARWSWLDASLAAALTIVLVMIPGWLLLLAYHL